MIERSARRSARPHFNLTTALFSILALLTACAITYLMVRQTILQWEHRIKFPFWDMGGVVSFLDDKPSPSLADLYWTFRDNEHRPIVSFIFYLWDRNWYGYSGELLYRAIFIANALLATSMLGILLVRHKLNLPAKILFATIVFYSFFSVLHYENLTWQKQIHEVSCLTFLSFGLFAAAAVSTPKALDRNRSIDITLALVAGLFCLAATYSFAFGLVSWPAVLMNAALMRWRRAPLLIVGAFAAFAVVSYALTFTIVEHHSNPAEAVLQPLSLASYILRVIGAPLFYMLEDLTSTRTATLLASVVAAGGLILAFSCLQQTYRLSRSPLTYGLDHIVAAHAAMIVIAALGMSLILALGRLTVNKGIDSRYAVVASLFWCALLTLMVITQSRSRARRTSLLFGVITLFIGAVPAKRYEDMIRMREQSMYSRAVLATHRLWPEAPQLNALYYDPETLLRFWPRPRTPFTSFAQREPFGWIGARLTDLQRMPESSRCFGYIDAVSETGGGASDAQWSGGARQVFMVTGWAAIAAPQSHLRWIVISDETNVGIGAGKTGLPRPDVGARLAANGINVDDQGLSGFQITAIGSPGQHVVIWGVDTAGRACQLAAGSL